MRSLSSIAVAVAVLAAFATASLATPPPCDFTAAVTKCAAVSAQTRCGQWRCLSRECPSEITMAQALKTCSAGESRAQPLYPAAAAVGVPRTGADGDDRAATTTQRRPAEVKPLLGSTPRVESGCLNVSAQWNVENVRALLYSFALDVYSDRSQETYSENMTLRWTGINDNICAPNVPRYSDCSSMVTWLYWNLFGSGVDFLNGENWSAGYTGSLKANGVAVGTDPADLKVGDLCFYYHPMHHVAIYVGGNMVVTHGMDPVGYYAYNYAPLDFCRRYLL